MIQQVFSCLGRYLYFNCVFENPTCPFSDTALGIGKTESPILDSLIFTDKELKGAQTQ